MPSPPLSLVPLVPSAGLASLVPIAADPARLMAAAQQLTEVAHALGAAVPALGAAWSSAAAALVRQRTGEALEACRLTTLAALGGCLEVLEGYARAMGGAAEGYRRSDQDAVPVAGASDPVR